MSKTITDSGTLAGTPSAFESGSYSSISNQAGPVGHDESGTSYATITCRTGSQAESYAFWSFDWSAIPAGATIKSVTGKTKCYASSTSYISTRAVQLYYQGTTAKGSAVSFSNSTSATQTLSCGTWTRAELDGMMIRVYGRRGTSNTSRSATMRFYGAEVTVEYEYEGTAYEVTASSTAVGVSVSPASEDVMAGGDYVLTINGSLAVAVVTDNGVDVTASVVTETGGEKSELATDVVTNGVESGASYAEYAVGRSADDPNTSSSNMYASQDAEGYAEYSFDFSAIPAGAVITNVEVEVYGHRESSTVDSTHVAQVACYCGSTAKGSYLDLSSTSNTKQTLTDCGSWTRDELQSAKLRFYVGYYGGLLGGISWHVAYTCDGIHTYRLTNVVADHVILVKPSSQLYVKVNGTWVAVRKAYEKQNGVWVEISDMSGVLVDGKLYATKITT